MAVCSHALAMTMALCVIVTVVVTGTRATLAQKSLNLDDRNSDVTYDLDGNLKRVSRTLKQSHCGGYTFKFAIGRACYVLEKVKIVVDGKVKLLNRMVPHCSKGYYLYNQTFCIRYCGGCFPNGVTKEDACEYPVTMIINGKCCNGFKLVGSKCVRQ